MSENSVSEKSELKRKKTVYTKINFWTQLIGVIVVFACLLVTIISAITSMPIKVHLAIVIVLFAIGIIDLIPLIVSWVKLIKINDSLTKTDEEENKAV